MKPKPPTKDVEIVLTITETAEGKLGLRSSIPDHAAGTVGMMIAEVAMTAMQDAMREAGQEPTNVERGSRH